MSNEFVWGNGGAKPHVRGVQCGSEIITSKRVGSEETNVQQESTEVLYSYHSDHWCELGDGGRRYSSVPQLKAFSAPLGERVIMFECVIHEPARHEGHGKQTS